MLVTCKTVKMTAAETKMWSQDTGGWFRDYMTNQTADIAHARGLRSAEIIDSAGRVRLQFAVPA